MQQDWETILATEMQHVMPADVWAVLQNYLTKNQLSLCNFVEAWATAPDGFLDRCGVNVEEIVSQETQPPMPVAIVVATIMHAIRMQEQR